MSILLEQAPSSSLTIFPDVVVLPTTETDPNTNNPKVTGGSIETETTFDCTKINLRRGSSGNDVKKLQTILTARGYYSRKIDSSFGIYTEKAVKKLQKVQGNTQDGIFGPKTCNKLQTISTTSNTDTGTSNKKQNNYFITDFKSISVNSDMEGLSHEVTIVTPHTLDKQAHIRKLQKTQFVLTKNDNTDPIVHEGYINDIKFTHTDDLYLIEIQMVGYAAFLDMTVDYEATATRSEHTKAFCKLAGLKANIDINGLSDDIITLKSTKDTTGSTNEGSGLTQLSGNDCTETINISARSFDIDTCKGGTKIGNSSANYAKDTASMTAKEALMDIYTRFHYGPSLSSSAVYYNNRRCPQNMWTKTGKFWGNCADISRLVKAVGEVHGLKVAIRHMSGHYYNLIEIDGKVYRFDCCCKSSGSYRGEITNNLTKRGGPWS